MKYGTSELNKGDIKLIVDSGPEAVEEDSYELDEEEDQVMEQPPVPLQQGVSKQN
jgi:hypothetical protein